MSAHSVGRAARARAQSLRRTPGVYSQGDFGPIVQRFEQTEMAPDSRGSLRADGEDFPENDQYAVDQFQRSEMRNFGAEAPFAESDAPRRNAVASDWKLRRYTGAGHEAPDHSELNLSHMGPDPRGTADEPDLGMARRHAWRRAGYLQRTLRGQDSAVQHVGDARPTEWEAVRRRRFATDLLRDRLKVFTTAYGNYTYRAPPQARPRAALEGQQHQDRFYADRHGLSGEQIADAMVRPANPASVFAAQHAATGCGGAVPDQAFRVASYAHIASGQAPVEQQSACRLTAQQQELALAREAQTTSAAAVARGAFETARQTATDSETFARARAALQQSGAPQLLAALQAGGGGAGAKRQRFDADWGAAQLADTRGAGQAHPHLRAQMQAASGGAGLQRQVDQADLGAQHAAALARAEAFARLAKTPDLRNPVRARYLAQRLEQTAGHFEPGAERGAPQPAAAPLPLPGALAAAPHRARQEQDFADAKQTANYAAAPVVTGPAAAALHRMEPLNDQTRAAPRQSAAPMHGVRAQEAVRRGALVESGTFNAVDAAAARSASMRNHTGSGRAAQGACVAASAALREGGGLGVSGGEGLAA